jgi:hypothetical protein
VRAARDADPDESRRLTHQQLAIITKCRNNLWYWQSHYLKVIDPVSGQLVPFVPWEDQIEWMNLWFAGHWPSALKARRVGFTKQTLAGIIHQQTFFRHIRSQATSQDIPTANDLTELWDGLESTMPAWMRQRRTKDSISRISLANGSTWAVRAPGRRGGRSIDAQIFYADEAAFILDLQAQLRAAEPAVEAAHGICAQTSTSDGLGNYFARHYLSSMRQTTKFTPYFAGYEARPDRDEAWWQRQMELSRDDPLAMYREYPRSVEEAFRAAGGLVYHVTQSHLQKLDRPSHAAIYRGMDFGNTSANPFVCLWLWHDHRKSPGILFDPDCTIVDASPDVAGQYVDGLDELWAYRRDPNTDLIVKENDHFCDALRYVVHGMKLFGLVYVYRILVVRPGEIDPMDPIGAIHRVLELSGWEQMDRERWRAGRNIEPVKATVGDPAGKAWIDLAHAQTRKGKFNLRVRPYERPKGPEPVEQGILWLKALLKGVYPKELQQLMTPKQEREKRWRRGRRPLSLEESLALFGKELDNPALVRKVVSRYRP